MTRRGALHTCAAYLCGHGLLVCDVHLHPDVSRRVGERPHLLLCHVVVVVDVDGQGVVHLPEAVEGVVEAQTVPQVLRQDGPVETAHVPRAGREARVRHEEEPCEEEEEEVDGVTQ